MKTFSPYFNDWMKANTVLVVLALFLIMLSGLFQFGIFALNQNYVISYFGVEPQDVALSIQISYVGILAFLPIQFRFVRYFEPRSYLLVAALAAILINLLTILTTDFYVFLVLRLFSGFVSCAIVGRTLTLLFGHLKKESSQIVGSTVFYGSVLGSVVFIGLLTSRVSDNAPWQHIYIYLISFNMMTILVVLLCLKTKAVFKRYPLYQLDWVSFFLSLISFFALACLFIYGPTLNWMEDNRCISAAVITVVGLLLLLVRQCTKKRPYLHLHVFKKRHFFLALILLGLYYGMKDSINLVYGYAGGVLHWNSQQIVHLAVINIAAMVIAMLFSAYILVKKSNYSKLLYLGGFLCLLGYHLWMFKWIGIDLSFNNLIFPVILQGFASGALFVPLVVFALGSVPAYTGFTAITVAAIARFIGSLNGSAGFYSLQQFYSQSYTTSFLGHLSAIDLRYAQSLDNFSNMMQSKGIEATQATVISKALVYKKMAIQRLLLSDRAVFKLLVLIIVAVLLVLITYRVLKTLFCLLHKKESTIL